MSKLILRELNDTDERAFLEGLKTWEGEELSWYTFCWKPGLSHEQHPHKAGRRCFIIRGRKVQYD